MKLFLAIAALLLAGVANSQTDQQYNEGDTAFFPSDTPTDSRFDDVSDATEIDGSVRYISDEIDENTTESLTETGQTQEEADLTESTLGTPPK